MGLSTIEWRPGFIGFLRILISKIVEVVKLPDWFKVETPVGTYNPDWAIVKHNDETVYLVRETKATKDFLKLSHRRQLGRPERRSVAERLARVFHPPFVFRMRGFVGSPILYGFFIFDDLVHGDIAQEPQPLGRLGATFAHRLVNGGLDLGCAFRGEFVRHATLAACAFALTAGVSSATLPGTHALDDSFSKERTQSRR
jgi:restriction endonuclease-like protein